MRHRTDRRLAHAAQDRPVARACGTEQPAGLQACLLLGLLLFDGENLLAIIVSASLADTMRKAGGAALLACGGLDTFIAVGCLADANFALADFTLLNGHC